MSVMMRCGWCGHDAVMIPIEHEPIVKPGRYEETWRIYKCPGCNAPSLVHGTAVDNEFYVGGQYPLKPLTVSYPESVPGQIATVAAEAHGCLSVTQLRGAVALARAVVEAAAKAKGITSGTIHAKIDKLFEQGLIYAHVKDAAHEVRLAGNEVAHGDLVEEPIDAEEAEAIIELMDMVLDGVFIAPAKSEAQAARRKDRKSPASADG